MPPGKPVLFADIGAANLTRPEGVQPPGISGGLFFVLKTAQITVDKVRRPMGGEIEGFNRELCHCSQLPICEFDAITAVITEQVWLLPVDHDRVYAPSIGTSGGGYG
jgi:hypothetical protein